jgi:hypothetical protein
MVVSDGVCAEIQDRLYDGHPLLRLCLFIQACQKHALRGCG